MTYERCELRKQCTGEAENVRHDFTARKLEDKGRHKITPTESQTFNYPREGGLMSRFNSTGCRTEGNDSESARTRSSSAMDVMRDDAYGGG